MLDDCGAGQSGIGSTVKSSKFQDSPAFTATYFKAILAVSASMSAYENGPTITDDALLKPACGNITVSKATKEAVSVGSVTYPTWNVPAPSTVAEVVLA